MIGCATRSKRIGNGIGKGTNHEDYVKNNQFNLELIFDSVGEKSK